eukprot:CAMPEP_0119358746 /NCGR_PEP_ID=MMETSP1334-20130426/6859_1 /TAXON_ID=127549 /ORGANISM="Calcidiscus leptoporus, Strain RCC1130" /LENGTH=321 /DNA_ID=CAMNT_0007373293 /DNA_START=57 /DNA_END=1022 /DNA_ORIENTATION=-
MPPSCTPVTKANYAHAETAVILGDYVQKIARGTGVGGVGVLLHQRAGHDPDERTILRPNFDTLYSFAVLDLNCAASVVLPPTDRYQILEVVDEDHWIPLIAAEPGRYELTKEAVGSRFAFAFVRTRVNMQDEADLKLAAEVQDGLRIEQAEPGGYEQPLRYDMEEILALRKAYNERRALEGVSTERIFGKKGALSEEMRNFGVALGWGGLPKEGAVYPFLDVVDSTDPHTLTLRDVPNHPRAFWSVTVYDEDGFARGRHYNVNSAFAQKDAQGAYVIHFGGDPSQANFLDIYAGWNVALRIYSPMAAYFDRSWTVPQLERA